MKEKIIEFLRPDKRKVILSILLPYIWVIFGLSLILYFSSSDNAIFVYPSVPHEVIFIIFYLIENLVMSVFIYPLACSIILIVDYYKTGRIKEISDDKGFLGFIIFTILVFNPTSLKFIGILIYIFTSLLSTTPSYRGGVEIVEVAPNSLAEYIRIEPNDIIVSVKIIRNDAVIADKRIENSADFFKTLNKTKPGDYIIFRKLGGSSYGHLLQEHEIGEWGFKIRETY